MYYILIVWNETEGHRRTGRCHPGDAYGDGQDRVPAGFNHIVPIRVPGLMWEAYLLHTNCARDDQGTWLVG